MLSQFHPTGTVVPPRSTSRATDDEITVGGPLTLDPEQHELPITIQVMVAQTPEAKPGEPDEERFQPKNAKIARGVVVIDKGDIVVGAPDTEWTKKLKAPTGDFRNGEARGIAVAVVPNPTEFAYETLTWCSHITLKVEQAAGCSAVDREARVGVDLA